MSPHLPAMKPRIDLAALKVAPLIESDMARVRAFATAADHPIFGRHRIDDARKYHQAFGLAVRLPGSRHPIAFALMTGTGPALLIEALAVVHEHRRQGIGRQLVEYIAESHSSRPLATYVPLANLAACRLFAVCGFSSRLQSRFFEGDDAVVFRRPIDQCEGK